MVILSERSNEARGLVFNQPTQINPDLKYEQIRANVFLPKCDSAGDCILKIWPGLYIHMERPGMASNVWHPQEEARPTA